MFVDMKISILFGLLTFTVLSQSTALKKRTERNPELIAGYFEGDIVLPPSSRNGIISPKRHWPNGVVYYKINSGHFGRSERRLILNSMLYIERKSCIRFKEAQTNQKYYINITGSKQGCYAAAGWWNAVQILNLGKGCVHLGKIIHELLHSLGFYHMQSAPNRNNYVRIAFENITPNQAYNFNVYGKNVVTDYGTAYDYGSIMHYNAYAFSVNGKQTIIPFQKGVQIGQRRAMSKTDIIKLNRMYNCAKT